MENQIVVRIDWKSEDGFQFIGFAKGHDWDVVSTTGKAVAQMEVGSYVWCTKKCNEDWGNYLEEVAFKPYATKEDWELQEKNA